MMSTTPSDSQLLAALTALRNGDLAARLPEGSETATVFNELAVMLGELNAEVRRIAREVGTEGRFGPQALVNGTQGEWTALVNDVNTMAANLTVQIRSIAMVTTAVARGDLTCKLTVAGQGEIQELKDTINVMVDQLSLFAQEVTRVSGAVARGDRSSNPIEVRRIEGAWHQMAESLNQMGTAPQA